MLRLSPRVIVREIACYSAIRASHAAQIDGHVPTVPLLQAGVLALGYYIAGLVALLPVVAQADLK